MSRRQPGDLSDRGGGTLPRRKKNRTSSQVDSTQATKKRPKSAFYPDEFHFDGKAPDRKVITVISFNDIAFEKFQ